MKIIEIIPQLSDGGAERFTVDLCNELVKKNEVTLIVLYDIDEYGFMANDLNKAIKLVSLKKKLGFDIRLLYDIYKILKKESPDIVHTHLSGIQYILFSVFLLPKIKYIHTIHNDADKEAIGLIKKVTRFLLFHLRKVIPVTISEESKKSFFNFYHMDSVLIYNGRPKYNSTNKSTIVKGEYIDLLYNKNAKILLNVARMLPQKNQISLSKAVDNTNDKEQVELFIIGREEKEIALEIAKLNSPYVHILGTRHNCRDYMHEADAFILSSLYEGMPITLIECFSVGAIPICTPVGGIKNMIVDGVNGILAKGTAVKDIENAILRFLNMSDDEKVKMHRASLASYVNYSMENCAENYLKLMSK